MIRAAAAAGVEAVAVTRSDSDYSPGSIAAIVDRTDPDLVFHGAGTASVSGSIERPDTDLAGSVALLGKILEGIRLSSRRPRLIYPSSAAVYGNADRQPIQEDSALMPISPYGRNKVACESMASEYAGRHRIPVLLMRIFSLVGEGQRRLLVWELFRQYQDSSEIVLGGSGDEERDYLHVDDCAALAWRCALHSSSSVQIVNMASGNSIRVRDLAERIGTILGIRKPVRALGKRLSGDPCIWRADISRLRALAGSAAPQDLDSRLRQVLAAWSR
jgi:UDP-glucose 4-epimerase